MSCINLQNGRLFGSKNVFLSSIELALFYENRLRASGVVEANRACFS